MMKIVLYVSTLGRLILFLGLINLSCTNNSKPDGKDIVKISEVDLQSNLKKMLKADLDCFRNNYMRIFKNRPYFDLYAEKEDDGYIIHTSTSKTLEIDSNCLGYFYIDTVIFTIYGEVVPELYDFKKKKLLKVDNFNKKKKQGNQSINDEVVSWHYQYKNGKVSYLIDSTCFQKGNITSR